MASLEELGTDQENHGSSKKVGGSTVIAAALDSVTGDVDDLPSVSRAHRSGKMYPIVAATAYYLTESTLRGGREVPRSYDEVRSLDARMRTNRQQ